VTWDEANAYAARAAKRTGKPYRLLTEAESEYAARGRTSPGIYPRFWFGDDKNELCRYGNFGDTWLGKKDDPWVSSCNDGYDRTSPAGHYAPNAFGLYDMFGDARQWMEDCRHDTYDGAPADGSAWTIECHNEGGHMLRGGSWDNSPMNIRAAFRNWGAGEYYGNMNDIGLRVARTLTR
jgi:formylglycine-generating enzyme required for sulfatase activity